MSEVFNVAVISSRINLWLFYCHFHLSLSMSHSFLFYCVCTKRLSVLSWLLKSWPTYFFILPKREKKSKIICNAWSWAWEEVEWGWDTKHKITYSHVVYTNLISTLIIGSKEPHYLCSFGYYFGQILIHCSGKVSLTVCVGTQTEADNIF